MSQELENLRRQVRGDFEFTCAALKSLGEYTTTGFEKLAADLLTMSAEMTERMRQIEGRMRLMDGRFDTRLTAVQTDYGDLEKRVTRLEQRSA